jgi:ATP-binding cassette subfamily B protein
VIRSLLRLRDFVARYRWRLIVGIAAFGIARVLEAAVPVLLGMSIDRIAGGDMDLLWPVLGIFGAVTGRFVVVTGARYLVRSAGLFVAFDLRQALYAALQHQGSRFFARHTIGDMMTRAVADISLIQRLIAMGTVLLVIMIYAPLVGFGFMLYQAPSLALLLLPPLPLVFYYARWSSRRMGVASRDVQDRLSDLGAHVQENLSGIRTIQAMVQEDNEIRRFAGTNQAYADAFYRQAWINSMMTAVMPALAGVCMITILGYGGYLVQTGAMTVGVLVSFIGLLHMVVQPFRTAGFLINLLQRAAVAADRLFDVLSLDPEIQDRPSGATPARITGRIEFRDLSYRFDGSDATVLDHVSLNVAPGETVALMGRVGAGKTTLLRLLVRLLDPPAGRIFVDGHDVRDYPLAQLRSQIAFVPQDPFLFGEPLGANLTYDDPQRALDQIWAAAASADLRDTIEEFPDRMETLVGERGVTLSGGQKQRATLARGLIRDAPVLVLDDCFSSVDTGTEEHILGELKRLRARQTTLLVSHRVSTARHADRIVVMEAGRVAEVGSHDELLARGGLYAELERIQREGAGEDDYAQPHGRGPEPTPELGG